MINKEIILGNGNIVKDFSDRNIPQNSHNQVCVSFLIPSNQFNDYDDYSVFTAVSRVVGNVETPLNALVLTASKSITIEGINYIKFSCVLSLDYTNVLGELRFSPYIQATIHTDSVLEDLDNDDEDEVITETLLSQNSYTYCKLNIIKAVRMQEDASLEEASTATTLAGQINSKKIYYNAEWNSLTDASENMLYYNIATSYNPSVALYNGSIIAVKNQNVVSFYFPYLNGANVELFKMTNEGVFYKISGISRTGEGTEQSPYVYNATKQKLTYTKTDVDGIESGLQTQINGKVDKTTKVNNKPLSSDITLDSTDVGLGNVANYGVESATPTASGDQLYITSKAVYDALQLVYTAISGCATDDDLTTINNRLDSIESIIGSDDGDADSVINTLKEVIVVLNGLGEGASLLDLINAKANQSDFTALNNQINGENGIKDKVDLLSERENAYMEIKNSLGTIDIAVEDWEANISDTDYPYKWTLTNGYLEGAVNCIVVYSKDSDTSMLSATTGIDEENGKLIIYASELPTETISIEKIAVFNDLNAYINYSNEIVQQVLQNTSAISDINNTKLPQYTKKTKTIGNFTASLEIVDGGTTSPYLIRPQIEIKKDATHKAQIYAYGNKSLGNDVYGVNMSVQNGSNLAFVEMTQDLNVSIGALGGGQASIQVGTHSLTFDANGDLKIDGNAVGGGGKQLYQHTIMATKVSIRYDGYSSDSKIYLSFISEDETYSNFSALISYFRSQANAIAVRGHLYLSNFTVQNYCIKSIEAGTNNGTIKINGTFIDGSNWNDASYDNVLQGGSAIFNIASTPL